MPVPTGCWCRRGAGADDDPAGEGRAACDGVEEAAGTAAAAAAAAQPAGGGEEGVGPAVQAGLRVVLLRPKPSASPGGGDPREGQGAQAATQARGGAGAAAGGRRAAGDS